MMQFIYVLQSRNISVPSSFSIIICNFQELWLYSTALFNHNWFLRSVITASVPNIDRKR